MDIDGAYVALVIVCLALLISVCLNITFCMRQKDTWCKEPHNCCHLHSSEEALFNDEGQYLSGISHREQQENPHNEEERQENPIYGNISTERRGSADACYETMSMPRSRDCLKPVEPDLNYASLDLKIAKKRKKHRHLQGQGQGRNKQQDLQADHLTPPSNAFLEIDAEVDAHLPCRDTAVMVSHSSIYLNSQQIAQEAEEMQRERGINMEEKEIIGWDGLQESVRGGRRNWAENPENWERKEKHNGSDGKICIQISEEETILSCSDQVTDSFSHDSG